MDLYYSPLACSMATRIALYEANQSANYLEVDKAKQVRSDGSDFLKVNPIGLVPTLRTDDGVVRTIQSINRGRSFAAEAESSTRLMR